MVSVCKYYRVQRATHAHTHSYYHALEGTSTGCAQLTLVSIRRVLLWSAVPQLSSQLSAGVTGILKVAVLMAKTHASRAA
jgi:hypothetical protein